MATATATKQESYSLLMFGLSLLGVLGLIVIAGSSDSAANLALVTVVGFWLVWLMRHPTAFATVAHL